MEIKEITEALQNEQMSIRQIVSDVFTIQQNLSQEDAKYDWMDVRKDLALVEEHLEAAIIKCQKMRDRK